MIEWPSFVAALGWTLIHLILQGLLVAGALAFARLGRASARMRYWTACAALAALVILPIATFELCWADWSQSEAAVVVSGSDRSEAAESASFGTELHGAMPWLLGFWSIGVGLMATRSIFGWVQLRHLVRHRTRELEARWCDRVDVLKRRLGLRSDVRVLVTRAITVPIVTGCLRPVVLLPLSTLTGLRPEDLETLILHELIHIQRGDLWVQRLQLVLETLFFYHPAVWWVSQVVDIEREFCCDEVVVSITGDRVGYARALTRMEILRSQFPQPALATTGGSLLSRIQKIVHPPTQAHAPFSTALCSLIAVGLLVFLGAATGVVGQTLESQPPSWIPASVSRWQPQIDKAAERHGVDPALLSIMTLLESRGNPEALSSWGAVGLMQIMPRTAQHIADTRGIEEFDLEDLHDPETNIDFGAWFLARQFETFTEGELDDESVQLAATAYNGGPASLRKHLQRGEPLSAESERYAQLVVALWRERAQEHSAAFENLTGKR